MFNFSFLFGQVIFTQSCDNRFAGLLSLTDCLSSSGSDCCLCYTLFLPIINFSLAHSFCIVLLAVCAAGCFRLIIYNNFHAIYGDLITILL